MPRQIVEWWGEDERIEVTSDGSLGGPADTVRQFIHGMPRYFARYNDGEVVEITEDHFRALMRRR